MIHFHTLEANLIQASKALRTATQSSANAYGLGNLTFLSSPGYLSVKSDYERALKDLRQFNGAIRRNHERLGKEK
jgi:hypothetical protein